MCLDCILRGSEEGLDPQVLFDPFEEKLDLPPTFVEIGDGPRRKRKVVGEKDEVSVGFRVVVSDSSEFRWIILLGIEGCRYDGLIALNPNRFVDTCGIEPVKTEVFLGPDNKISCILMDGMEPGKIEIAAIDDIQSARFDADLIEDIYIVDFAVSDNDHRRYAASQIKKGMQLDGSFSLAEDGPGKQRQAQVDDG